MIDPIPSTPVPRRRRRLALWLGIGAGMLALCCAGTLVLGLVVGPPKKTASPARSAAAAAPAAPSVAATSVKPSPARAPSTAAVPPSPTAPADPDHRLCRLTANGGTFYVSITSATAHRFDACAGGTDDPRTLDDLLLKSTDGMDRRCILGDAYTAQHEAIVGVYSSTKTADLAAARQFCRANGGTQ